MTTTLIDPALDSAMDLPSAWRRDDALAPAATPDQRPWLLDARRREETFASQTAFLISAAVTIVLSGVAAYFFGLWMYGPT